MRSGGVGKAVRRGAWLGLGSGGICALSTTSRRIRLPDATVTRTTNRYHHNLLCLGDFNIDREGDALYDAFVSTGLATPPELAHLPRTVFDDPGDDSGNDFYDQIAWFHTGSNALIDLGYATGGNFDSLPHVYTDTNLTRSSISYRVSDHYPLWVEMRL